MRLFRSLLQAVRNWRRRRGGPKTNARANVLVERLDHRQLLSGGIINFTGNVTTDFPSSLINKGVVEQAYNPNTDVVADVNTDPALDALIGRVADPLAPSTAPYNGTFSKNGFAIDRFRVSYDPTSDTLLIGLIPPGPDGTKIIAGDVDNQGQDNSATNDQGNSANLSPTVQAYVDTTFPPLDGNGHSESFVDYPDMQRTEEMFAFLDLNGDGTPDIAAGFAPDLSGNPNAPAKVYQVATYDNTNPTHPPFGTELPQYEGNVYLVNDPSHPNLEFAIKDFSQLYASVAGHPLDTKTDSISVGVQANSLANPVLNGSYLALKTIPMSEATLPQPCPVNPPIQVNPHQNFHVNSAHPTDVQVVIYGGTNFNVNDINQSTVTINGVDPTTGSTITTGAMPITDLTSIRYVNHDAYQDIVLDFNGHDLNSLPAGLTQIQITGQLNNGQAFRNTVQVFNRNDSFYSAGELQHQAAKQAAMGGTAWWTPNLFKYSGYSVPNGQVNERASAQQASKVTQTTSTATTAQASPAVSSDSSTSAPVVSIPMRDAYRAVNVDPGTGTRSGTGSGTGKTSSSSGPVVSIPMSGAYRNVKVDSRGGAGAGGGSNSAAPKVSIPTARGTAVKTAQRLRVDMSAAR